MTGSPPPSPATPRTNHDQPPHAHPVDAAQPSTDAVEILSGPLIEAPADHAPQHIVEQLPNLGAEVTGVTVEPPGRLASW